MKNLPFLLALSLFIACEPVPTQSSNSTKKLVLNDYNYESIVGMTQLVPTSNGIVNELENPVLILGERPRLIIRFDLLTDQFEYLAGTIYHCNKDWTKSMLRDMEFLDKINTFRVDQFDYSLNTRQPYINYRAILPTPTISGNYIVAIHRRGSPDDVILTRKFLVADNISVINQQVLASRTVSKRNINQQIDFTVNYGKILVNNPMQDLSVVLLQNHRWRDAITDLKPSLIRPSDHFMEFRNLDGGNNFSGWNEFRFFDFRTNNIAGRNIRTIENVNGATYTRLLTDQSRGKVVYGQNLRDLNGNFILENNDLGEIFLNSDYAFVKFTLEAEKVSGDVYVVGRFNDWKLTGENEMRYNPNLEAYQTSIFLKQGYYDYHYYVKSPDLPSYHFEGSHMQTENSYEILVYYRQPGTVNDQLIGYKKFNTFVNN